MLTYLIVCLTAFVVAGLTLFSGFGLGTLLMPAFALFFPLPVAVAATAVVHLANNLFKAGLVGRNADWGVVARFAIPGAVASVAGALLLNFFAALPPLTTYRLGESEHAVSAIGLVMGIIIIAFALLDLLPRFQHLAFDRKYLPLGGLLSGFFGGISGNQGALRAAFLIKAGLDKQAFISTGVICAVIIDIARLLVYGLGFYASHFKNIPAELSGLVLAATLAAFGGSFLGARIVQKVTLRTIQVLVGALLVVVGAGMAAGLV